MTAHAAPDVRPAGAVLLRALAAGAILGGLAGVVVSVGGGSDLRGLAYTTSVLLFACPVGGGVALLSATGWLVAVHHGPGWLADLVAGVAAAGPFAVLFRGTPTGPLVVVTVVVGLLGALVARWQGRERDRRPPRVRPRSSPRAG